MELWHYSVKPIAALEPRSWTRTEHDLKPRGAFWFSDDAHGNGWWDWVEQEGMYHASPRWDYRWKYPIEVSATALLWTVRPQDVRAFHAEYRDTPAGPMGQGFPDWRRIAAECDGIVFTPYSDRELLAYEYVWYYTVDCASGFVFDHAKVRLGEGVKFR